MTRKDLIIVAVLVNAGVLVALFAGGLKGENNEHEKIALNTDFQESNLHDLSIEQVFSLPQEELKEQIVVKKKVEAKEQIDIEPPATKPAFADDVKALDEITPQPAKSTRPTIEIIVKKGDVLEKIAHQHNTNVDEIMKLNNLKNSKLKIGQKLIIESHEKKEKAKVNDSDNYYVVKNGDNPWTIAVKNRLKVEELLRLNNLDEEKARRLKPGDRLRIK